MHSLRLGLQGSLIPFATLAFVSQRQNGPRYLLSPLVFLSISTHFTATLIVPVPPNQLNSASISSVSKVEPWSFKRNLAKRLQTLYAQ